MHPLLKLRVSCSGKSASDVGTLAVRITQSPVGVDPALRRMLQAGDRDYRMVDGDNSTFNEAVKPFTKTWVLYDVGSVWRCNLHFEPSVRTRIRSGPALPHACWQPEFRKQFDQKGSSATTG